MDGWMTIMHVTRFVASCGACSDLGTRFCNCHPTSLRSTPGHAPFFNFFLKLRFFREIMRTFKRNILVLVVCQFRGYDLSLDTSGVQDGWGFEQYYSRTSTKEFEADNYRPKLVAYRKVTFRNLGTTDPRVVVLNTIWRSSLDRCTTSSNSCRTTV